MDAEKTRDNLRSTRTFVKVASAAMTAMGAVHCMMLYAGIDHLFIHLSWCGIALWLGIHLNRMFGLCKIHLCSVFYITSILVLMTLEHHISWCSSRLITGTLSAAGIIIAILMIWTAVRNC